MINDRKIKRINEYFSRKREFEKIQLANIREQSGAVADLHEKKFPNVAKDKESGLPKKYVSGLSTATSIARKRHWDKTKKMDDNNPSAYKLAPGDKNAKTKQSKYTKKYYSLYGEDIDIELTEAANSALSKKADKSGVSLSTLKKVYARGVAAWRTGHRPGTTPQQWGFARVNSYITKGKTYHTADKDLREDEVDEACWTGYTQKGMKKKVDKMVPNCVPVKK